jgi:hypothetical protein
LSVQISAECALLSVGRHRECAAHLELEKQNSQRYSRHQPPSLIGQETAREHLPARSSHNQSQMASQRSSLEGSSPISHKACQRRALPHHPYIACLCRNR